ncbi:unnamed protein product [Enterobius vermicularis]|uniref:Deoxyuridine 5'-triphosphate nucleotidohydrolase n=1 Tax=Enterobius vermicularis TaxID=51028 RepID=A0A0N4VPM0_ENTVE|nr:unnamed protein product [Enterobius vermicularis]
MLIHEFQSDDGNKRLVLKFKKLGKNATAPSYGSSNAAGADLYSACDCTVPPKGKYLVPTEIQIEVPEGCYGRVAPRFGLADKNFVDVGAGVIDPDYRGEVKVLLFNHGTEELKVCKGDRIAQLICERFERCEVLETELDVTDRGDGGFGSTGV